MFNIVYTCVNNQSFVDLKSGVSIISMALVVVLHGIILLFLLLQSLFMFKNFLLESHNITKS